MPILELENSTQDTSSTLDLLPTIPFYQPAAPGDSLVIGSGHDQTFDRDGIFIIVGEGEVGRGGGEGVPDH